MIVKLKKNLFDYLDYNLSEEQEVLRLKFQVKKEGQSIFIEVDNGAADEVRDWAMNKQIQIGFDVNYELNSEGKILEELIDAFYIG